MALREDWDIGKGMPKQDSDDLIKLSLYLDLKLKGEDVTAQGVKNVYLGKGDHHYTIVQLIGKTIEKYKVELAPGSLKNYMLRGIMS